MLYFNKIFRFFSCEKVKLVKTSILTVSLLFITFLRDNKLFK